MKTATPVLMAVLVGLAGCVSRPAPAPEARTEAQARYPAGSQQSFAGPPEFFTGDVRVDMVFPGNDTARYSGAYVTFAPGARTAWHLHPAGQHMIVTSGVGLTGTRDGKIVEIRAGDAVWCPPDVDHWHGATPDSPMTHFVITGSRNGKNVVWKEHVSDAEYLGRSRREKEVPLSTRTLTERQRALVPIAAFTANGDLESLKAATASGLDAGLTVNEIKEVALHLYAYAGFPRALNGLATLMSVVDERKAAGIEDEAGAAANPMPPDGSSLERGREVQTRLSGQPVSGPLFDFAPAANELLQRHLFGDLFARGVLDEQDREIVTLSALASMDRVEPQLKAHVRIASNVGVPKAGLGEVAAVLRETVGETEGRRAGQALESVLP